MSERVRHYDRNFAAFSAARIDMQRRMEADRTVEVEARLNLLARVNAVDGLPQEIHYQVDSGKEGGTDLVFNTREIGIYMMAGDHLAPIYGVDWVMHYEAIVEAIIEHSPDDYRNIDYHTTW